MCLAFPMMIRQRTGEAAVVEAEGVQREISLALLPDAAPGEWVLVHAGFAIGRIDEGEAAELLAMLREMAEAAEP